MTHKGEPEMTRCLGCMKEYGKEYEICPYCGYVAGTPPREAYHMSPGTILANRYLIGRVLGFGGFGVTYIGWDKVLLREVAVKEYLPGEFSTRIPGQTEITTYEGERSEQFNNGLGKFLEEAKMLAKLEAANGVVRIYDSFRENNTAYIVMEYLEGRTLKEYLEQYGKLSVEEAKEILRPILTALKEVHGMGILHRDIAPDNIFLTNDGMVKLLDFGASRFATTSHSKSLSVIIKPGYAPVEQYRSRGDQGAWTDVYSLAATFYKMVTGVTPEDAMERVEKEELKKPSRLGAAISGNVEHGIMNALNIRIEDRTQDIETFEKELYGKDKVKRRFVRLKKSDVGRWPLWAKLATSAATFAVLVFAVLLATGVIDYSRLIPEGFALPEGMTRVPNLVNEEVDTANAMAEEAGLILQIVDKQYSEYVPLGMVLSQNLSRGKIVKVDNVVEVAVSGGREPVILPDVCGIQKDSARETLSALGLVLEIKEEYGAFEAGAVMTQSPEAGGQAFRGDTVVLTVSLGLDTYLDGETEIGIPDLSGMSLQQATARAEELGLYLVKTGEREEGGTAPGTVLEQSPRAGAAGYQGDTVKIVVAAVVRPVYVPDVQYKEMEAASAELEALGYVVSVNFEESATVARNKVIRQSVAANAEAGKGTEILLTVSSGTAAVNQITAQKPEWSQWVTELPEGVNGSGYEIDKKEQYSFRDKSVTTSSEKEMRGWTLYDTTTAKGGYGEWSEWSSEKPAEQEGREISEKVQYCYSDYETMVSDQASVEGWNLADTRTYHEEDYGSFGDWSDTPANASDTRKVETRTQYQTRTRSKEYQDASTKTLAGYTLIDRGESEGGWSDWSETPVSSGETESGRVEVETEQRTETNSVYDHTEFLYYHWAYKNPDDGYKIWYTWAGAYAQPRGGWYEESGWGAEKPQYMWVDNYCWAYRTESDSALWYYKEQRDVYRDEVYSYTVYRSRNVSYTYHFWRWSDWSDWSAWSDTPVAGDETTEVNTKTQYRYSDRIPHYEYTHERWTEYSAWSDTECAESQTRKVQTRTVYKYRDSTDVVTYHFYQWGAWSDWRDEQITESDSREVQRRTLYRYRAKQ